jgi:glycosyltransferase involved in cell wall biosynthesis
VIDAIRRFEPDVVHHAQEHSDWRLLLAQLSARKVPMVLTIHDVVPHLGSAPAPNWLQKRVARKLRRDAAAYVVHGRALADELRTQPWYNGRTVYPIPHLPLRRVQAPEPLPERPTLLFFGRLEYYKGLDIFIRAVELAAARIPELRAIVAGRGVEATRCRGLVTKPELFDWREGFVAHDAVRNTFSEASVIVLPYREASQSGVIPLAFGFGRPVIATAVGGLPEVVENGVNGVLVPVAEPESIAQAIVTMVGDRDLLERLARGAMASVTEGDLSSRKVAEMHLRAYGEVASRAIR